MPDKKAYEVGDVARVLVKSPFREADALVTVERSGIYRQERVHLVGATPTLTVPITEDLRPNAFVSVHLVRGRTPAAPARGADVGAPGVRVRLRLAEHRPGVAAPEGAADAGQEGAAPGRHRRSRRGGDATAPASPRRRELTLWAVDEGVLMLTGYATPDPLPDLHRAAQPGGLHAWRAARTWRASSARLTRPARASTRGTRAAAAADAPCAPTSARPRGSSRR